MSATIWRLDLHVTEACNLACPYCFARERRGPDLSPELAHEALRWLLASAQTKAHVTLWGGEPLLRLPLLEAIVRDARRAADAAGKPLSLSLPTNATLLSARALEWITANAVKIFLSVDGDEQTQALRPLAGGGNSHALASAGLRRAVAATPRRPPAARMTVTAENAHRQLQNARHLAQLGIRELLIYPAFDNPWPAGALQAFADGQRALAELVAAQLGAGPRIDRVPRLKAWVPILRRLLAGSPARQRRGPARVCDAGTQLVALTTEGGFAPCHRFVFYGRQRGAIDLGDLRRGFDRSAAAPFAALTVEQMRGVERCTRCELFDLCTHGCTAINYAGTGELTAAPPAVCALMRAQIAACRQLYDALAGDPRLALYVGRSLDDVLHGAAGRIGERAWALYRSPGK